MSDDTIQPAASAIDQPAAPASQPQALEKPNDDELAKKWGARIAAARKHWSKLHKRMAHNRKVVAGFNWKLDPDTGEFVDPRANLMFSTAQATLPNIYARNPDVSVSSVQRGGSLRLFCETLETVISGQTRRAKLKKRMKLSVLAAMINYWGVVKITYQRDIQTDPIILDRINDTQDNIVRLEGLLQQTTDTEGQQDAQAKMAELQDVLKGLESRSEIVAAEGLVIDRIQSDQIILDPTIVEFDDYEEGDFIAQLIPMRRADGEARFKVDLSGAKAYKTQDDQRVGSGGDSDPTPIGLKPAANQGAGDDEDQICVIEIWDKRDQLVRTLVEGCNFWVREPFPVQKVGQRWYPYFILPYAILPGMVVAPCLVDLTEKLQGEYNETRDKFADHRELNKPGWIADKDSINERDIKRHKDAVLGEITLVDAQGKSLNQIIQPRMPIPINPVDYDTGPIRSDWEQVTGLQDAARSTVVQAKTATEANIQQQSLSGRTSEFRDKSEDLMQEMFEYSGQILLQELTPAQVERYTGPNKTGLAYENGMLVEEVTERSYDWPQLTRDQIFDLVEINIVAGSSGAPDKTQQQQIWTQAFPLVQQLITQIMQLNAQSIDYAPLEALLRETLKRFDDRIDVDQFLPAKRPAAAAGASGPTAAPGAPVQPGQPAGAPPQPGGAPVSGMPPNIPPQAPPPGATLVH